MLPQMQGTIIIITIKPNILSIYALLIGAHTKNLLDTLYSFTAEGFAWLSGLNASHPAEDDKPVKALLDREEYSSAKLDLVKKLHRVTAILCHSEVHGNLMKALNHCLQSKGLDAGNVIECWWRMYVFEGYRMHPDDGREAWRHLCAVKHTLIYLLASEVTCEHVIFIMEYIFPKSHLSVKTELIRTQLRIRLNEFWELR
jgi:hypothetical protein